jgi:hypothetical protein
MNRHRYTFGSSGNKKRRGIGDSASSVASSTSTALRPRGSIDKREEGKSIDEGLKVDDFSQE